MKHNGVFRIAGVLHSRPCNPVEAIVRITRLSICRLVGSRHFRKRSEDRHFQKPSAKRRLCRLGSVRRWSVAYPEQSDFDASVRYRRHTSDPGVRTRPEWRQPICSDAPCPGQTQLITLDVVLLIRIGLHNRLCEGDGHQTLNPSYQKSTLHCVRILDPRSGLRGKLRIAGPRIPRYRLPTPFALGGLPLCN